MSPGYGPAAVVSASGAALLLLAALATTDAAVVGGTVLGAAITGTGAMLAWEAWRDRRRRAELLDGSRTAELARRQQDRSTEARAPRRAL